ncbi:hypothetical protein RFI_18490 [Reticulomyxa filosa]|uniref:Uncharacterized protein n=1 Tax=Reticulomyxa filosa TaxID=46433 RepID=X6MXL2_RETFI|nr:hypothetical protein RFI_18490 [Reticulomyxa filosa]|eukprot:ETO18765.1 hypothetical protein RFI_18490 [Reticulomyxa filosa]
MIKIPKNNKYSSVIVIFCFLKYPCFICFGPKQQNWHPVQFLDVFKSFKKIRLMKKKFGGQLMKLKKTRKKGETNQSTSQTNTIVNEEENKKICRKTRVKKIQQREKKKDKKKQKLCVIQASRRKFNAISKKCMVEICFFFFCLFLSGRQRIRFLYLQSSYNGSGVST